MSRASSRWTCRPWLGLVGPVLGCAASCLCILAVGQIARMIVWGDAFDSADSAYYYQRAREVCRGNWQTESLVVSHLHRWESVQHPAFDHWQPLPAFAYCGVSLLVGEHGNDFRRSVILLGTVIPGIVVGAVVLFETRTWWVGVIASACFLTTQSLVYFRSVTESVVIAGWLLLCGCACLSWAADSDASARSVAVRSFACGVCLALFSMCRGEGAAVSVLLLTLGQFLIGSHRQVVRMVGAGSGLLSVYMPWVLRNLKTFESPTPPGSAHAPFVTEYTQWADFIQPSSPALRELIAARVESLVAAFHAVPSHVNSLLVVLCCVGLVLGAKTRSLPTLAIVSVISYHLVGLMLAPALTLWNYRSGMTYTPLLISAAWVSVWGIRRASSVAFATVVGVAATIFVVQHGALVTPEPREISPVYAIASTALPCELPVMSNSPLPLYVYRPNVVRIPRDGIESLGAAARHYKVQSVVLFEDALAWSSPWVRRVYEADTAKVGQVTLECVKSLPGVRVYRLAHSDVYSGGQSVKSIAETGSFPLSCDPSLAR